MAMRRLAVLLATTLLTLTGVAAAPSAQAGPETKYARQAFTATNDARADAGLKALRKNRCLQRFATAQARLMAQREEMFHQELGPVLKACGLSGVGENVAYGYGSGRSVVDDGWMNSEGHRANILGSSYRLMAIGARKGHDGRWYVAQVFGAR